MTAGDNIVTEGCTDSFPDDDAQTLYELAPCGYLSTRHDGTIIKVNQTFLALTGYAREDLVGRKRFVDLLTAGGKIYHETHYAPMLRMQSSAREIALDLVGKNGRRLPALINSVLERDAADNPTIIRTAVFDATHRRQYEQELLHEKQRAEASEARATALARTLQQTLIPPHLPDIDGLELGAEYRAAGDGSEVGGDFYDIFQTGDQDWVVVIGDVCGKGVDAAVVTALARYTLRAAAVQHPEPTYALSLLNEALLRANVDRFCTAAVLRMTRLDGEWRVTSCVAGHPLPLHVDGRGRVTPIGLPGPLLGVLAEVTLTAATVTLAPGETCVAYTDGVTEGRRETGEFYGEARLFERLGADSGHARNLARGVLADVLDFQHDVARDDIAIVALRAPSP